MKYGACRHIPKFHRYIKNRTPSTDDEPSSERVLNCDDIIALDSPCSGAPLPGAPAAVSPPVFYG